MVYHKRCFVPECKNTLLTTPQKIFFIVPADKEDRIKWYSAAKRCIKSSFPKSKEYCCQDHFELPTDVENWLQHKLMKDTGFAPNLHILKKNVLPHIFKCQFRDVQSAVERIWSERRKRKREADLIHLTKKMREYPSSNNSFQNNLSANIKLERDGDPDSTFINSENTYCINNDGYKVNNKRKFPLSSSDDDCFDGIKSEERESDIQIKDEDLLNEFPVQDQANYKNSECNTGQKSINPGSQTPDSSNNETLLANKEKLKNRGMKAKLFETISRLMLVHSFTFSPAEIRKKYDNFRIRYKKIKDACKSKDARKRAVVTWEYFGIMDELYWKVTPDLIKESPLSIRIATLKSANNLIKEPLSSDSKLVCDNSSINSATLHTVSGTNLYNEPMSSVPLMPEPIVESIIIEVCPPKDLNPEIEEKNKILLEEQENSFKNEKTTNGTNTDDNNMFVEDEISFNANVEPTLSSIDEKITTMNANTVAINTNLNAIYANTVEINANLAAINANTVAMNTNLAAANINMAAMNKNMAVANATLVDLSKVINNLASGLMSCPNIQNN